MCPISYSPLISSSGNEHEGSRIFEKGAVSENVDFTPSGASISYAGCTPSIMDEFPSPNVSVESWHFVVELINIWFYLESNLKTCLSCTLPLFPHPVDDTAQCPWFWFRNDILVIIFRIGHNMRNVSRFFGHSIILAGEHFLIILFSSSTDTSRQCSKQNILRVLVDEWILCTMLFLRYFIPMRRRWRGDFLFSISVQLTKIFFEMKWDRK